MAILETFTIWGLPILQSMIATAISNEALKFLDSDDGSDNDAFRKVMREAFVDAVKNVKGRIDDNTQKNYATNEFRYYLKVLIDDLVKLEPVDKKKYIEQDLYAAFKTEVLKRKEALLHINVTLTQEAVRNQLMYAKAIDDMNQLIIETNQKIDNFSADVQTVKEFVANQQKTFKEISSNLRGIDKYLAKEYHVKRSQTALIMDWIQTATPRKPEERICLVTGEAGCGKTVVMADLLEELEKQQVATIGLKSDYIFDANETDIDKALNIQGGTLIQIVEESAQCGMTVLIIDQVDALSLSLTFKRKPLAEVQRVVTHLSKLENVRIVMSCREYDFRSERAFYRYNGCHHVIVDCFNRNEVDKVLSDFNIKKTRISDDEYRFLQNPMNLSIYCRLMEGNDDEIQATESSVYDSYWRLVLMNNASQRNIDSNQLMKYLEKLVGCMIQEQVLSLNVRRFDTCFNIEQAYMLSEGYLAQSNNGEQVQFRHQTLFDYTYSRLFFESGRSIEADYQDVHQGLFVRGRIKTLLVYLREISPEQYISCVKKILQSNKYRFHLKQLVVSLLGSFANLTSQEDEILYGIIIPDLKFSNLFLRTVYAIGPVLVLIRYIKSNGGFLYCDWRYVKRVLDLLSYIIEQDWKIGISILSQMEINQMSRERLSSVINTICYLPIINSEMADNLLPIIQTIDRGDGEIELHHFYANLASIRPNIVAERIKSYVAFKLSLWDSEKEWQFDLSGDLWDMIEALNKADVHLALTTNLEIVIMMLEASIMKSCNVEIATSSLYWIYNRVNDSFNFPDRMLDLVLQQIEIAVDEGRKEIDDILSNLAQKNIAICHVIAMTGWLKSIEKYKRTVFVYLITNLKRTELSSILRYYQIKIFGAVFMLLSQDEQLELIELAKSVVPECEKGLCFIPNSKEYRYRTPNSISGLTKGRLLNTIPNDYLKDTFNDAWKELEEIKRKGFDIKNEAPNKMESYFGWPTIPAEKLEKMTVDNYIKLAEKYNSDYDSDWKRPTRVGLAWTMREVLKDDPDKGYDVYKQLIINRKADLYYVSSALANLQKSGISEYKLEEIYTLLIGAIDQDVNAAQSDVVIDICRALDYYIDNNKVAPKVLMDYVIRVAYEAEDNHDVDYADVDYNTGINQVRGCAVDHLVRSISMAPYTDEIFMCLDDIADTASTATRCAALFQMAVMMRCSKEKTLKLFLRLVHDYDENLLKLPVHSMNPILYLISYNFDALKDYFEHCVQKPVCHEVNVVWLLYAALGKKEGAEDLLFKMADASEEGRAALVWETEKYYDRANHQLIETILRRYLNYDEENLGKSYDRIFKQYELWPEETLITYLDSFFESSVCKHCKHYVYKFLVKFSDKNPHKTLFWLLALFMKKESDKQMNNTLMEALLAAYNKILVFDKSDQVLEDAMDLLDGFLQSEDEGMVALASRGIANV